MTLDLRALAEAGALSTLDVAFAETVGRIADEARPHVLLCAALASRCLHDGDVCVDLAALSAKRRLVREDGRPMPLDGLPDAQRLAGDLSESPLVGDGTGAAPLVLDERRLYLARAFRAERRLAQALRARVDAFDEGVDGALLRDGLDRLFGPPGEVEDRQRTAALLAVQRRFAVVSGGPGTGKTSTVVKILALLVEQARARGLPAPRMHLVAPTGKAAARLVESIRKAKAALRVDEQVKAAIPEAASTIHRALGSLGKGRAGFRHDAHHPLATDLVLVDESSMVDLALMDRLVDAVPASARLLLLGDKDQLASVESGDVLGDLCGRGLPPRRSRALVERVRRLTGDAIPLADEHAAAAPGVWDCLVHLDKSHRYGPDSGIARLAAAIQRGDADAALAALSDGDDVALSAPVTEDGLSEALASAVIGGYRDAVRADSPRDALAALSRFRVLCAHRRGPFGVLGLNQRVREALADAGLVDARGESFRGRPILVLENDAARELFNGDVGVLHEAGDGRGLQAYFLAADGRLRALSPSWLPPHQTTFAMTVHKSQGSEFDEVHVVLPTDESPLCTRELLYTAVTRAKQRVVVHATKDAVRRAVQTPTRRVSGLRDLLWSEAPPPTSVAQATTTKRHKAPAG